MISVFVYRNGVTERHAAVDPAWLAPDSGVYVWVDLAAPPPEEFAVLGDVFHFHPLAIEDAVAEMHHPKVEAYDGYLYLVLHGIHYQKSQEAFATHDTDFFLGPNYLVTVHDGQTRTMASMHELCQRNTHVLAEGPAALAHRIVDQMVEHYRPEVEELENWLDDLEQEVFARPRSELVRELLQVKRDVTALRRIAMPQRDIVSRLARREFPLITQELSYRFRDVYDDLVRLSDEALLLQDRVSSLLDAHLSNVSNRLNSVMKVLTVITVIFMPLTLVAGLYGMNMKLPLVGSDTDPRPFWWLVSAMAAAVVAMLAAFRWKRWI
ncbi:MAG TPA: magnesium/cobalt transporter CorA [Vicinamibacterales bacterium]|nr:magnesium/cobalt transporter CorA [Vicinamibacterales bacterium]